MIKPADLPRIALLSNERNTVRLESILSRAKDSGRESGPTKVETPNWVAGRAGMMYRDLLPDRLGGKVIASQIRITDGGEVRDSVHYHKIAFQIIYCLKGAIRVVYEDQGEPFWLRPGDCVLQPPEIRHRVLEAEAGSEVLEITSPAEHETWFDHRTTLPTAEIKHDRDFNSQRFVRYVAKGKSDTVRRELGVKTATSGRHDAYIEHIRAEDDLPANEVSGREVKLFFRTSVVEMLVVKLKNISL